MNGEGGDWPVGKDGQVVFGDARTSLTQWAQRLTEKSDNFRIAMDTLAKAGSDPVKLAWLLYSLSNAQGWKNISREVLGEIIMRIEKAANDVRTLFFSQLNQLLGLDSLKLQGELLNLVKLAKNLEPRVHARRPMGRDLVRATLVHYVRETT